MKKIMMIVLLVLTCVAGFTLNLMILVNEFTEETQMVEEEPVEEKIDENTPLKDIYNSINDFFVCDPELDEIIEQHTGDYLYLQNHEAAYRLNEGTSEKSIRYEYEVDMHKFLNTLWYVNIIDEETGEELHITEVKEDAGSYYKIKLVVTHSQLGQKVFYFN